MVCVKLTYIFLTHHNLLIHLQTILNLYRPPVYLRMSNGAEAQPPSSSSSSSTTTTTKQYQRDMIEFIEQPVDSLAADAASMDASNIDDSDTINLVRCIAKAADGRKADDIVALRVNHVSTLTTFLVILSGNSRPQNQAIAAAIVKDVEEHYGLKPGGTGVPEGSPESGWMVLDYGSVMVHIMTPKSRLYYNVEGQWRDKGGEAMDLSDVLIPNSVVLGNDGNNAPDTIQAEDDPFWS